MKNKIKELIELLREEEDSTVDSTECNSMSENELYLFKEGVRTGFEDCILLLEDEI